MIQLFSSSYEQESDSSSTNAEAEIANIIGLRVEVL